MKVAFISDIHGNDQALKAVLNEIKKNKVSRIFCLGDSVGYFPGVNETLEVIRRAKILTVIGDHEKAILEQGYFDSYEAQFGLIWSQKHLTKESREFIRKTPKRRELQIKGLKILVVHGSPWDETNEYIYPNSNFSRFGNLPYDMIVMGHTHIPFVRKFEGKYIINAGSVGLSRDNEPRAAVVFIEIAENSKISVDIKRVSYNPDRLAEKIKKLNFPRVLLNYLYFGQKKTQINGRKPDFNLKGQIQHTIRQPWRIFKAYKFFTIYRNQLKELFEIGAYEFVRVLTNLSKKEFEKFQSELFSDSNFFFKLKAKADQYSPGAFKYNEYQGWNNLYYIIIRKLRPEIIVETGVERGVSSAFTLKALRDNKYGHLYSIDLPAHSIKVVKLARVTMLPPGQDPGWIIPPDLKSRWELFKGKSEVWLPKLLSRLESIDIFLHDSLHTYEHMLWEFETAWSKIRKGGLLLADNIDWPSAGEVFSDFAREVGRTPVHKYGFGGIKK